MRVTTGHRYFTSKSEGKKTQFLVKGKRKIRNILVGARVRYGTQRVGSKMTPPANTKEKKKPLKWYCDENHIFPIEPILKHKQVACMTRKMLFTIFKYLFSFQRYLSF